MSTKLQPGRRKYRRADLDGHPLPVFAFARTLESTEMYKMLLPDPIVPCAPNIFAARRSVPCTDAKGSNGIFNRMLVSPNGMYLYVSAA